MKTLLNEPKGISKGKPDKYSPIGWNDSFYQVMGGGYCVCYLMNHRLHNNVVALFRHPEDASEWRIGQIYVNDANREMLVSIPMYDGLQSNTPLPTRLNGLVNKILPSRDLLYAKRGGCCCHWTPKSRDEDDISPIMPEVQLCDAPEHFLYFGPDFMGQKMALVSKRSKVKNKRR